MIGIAAQTYPPDVLPVIEIVWLGLTHLLIFFSVRAPVYAALTTASVYMAARYAF